MTPKKPTTKDVEKSFYSNFMKRAQECFHAAQYSYKHEEWTATAISAIHSTIAACDAMCVYFLGQRAAGASHNEAITLFKAIDNSKEISTNANRIAQIIRTKNIAEYEKRLIFKSEAEKILNACKKFLEFAKKKLP
ncbi:MAG: hypothetical protein KAS99_02010 [Candidatus Omnitrophica bacterium]|nr:hypothetical protein [Candidatus Omnitrophota bacterium]